MEQKMEKTRVGIIGTGNISNAHMEGYNTLLDSVELAACCDLDREKAEAFAKRYGFAKVYTDYNEMLANEKLDAVSVCVDDALDALCDLTGENASEAVIEQVFERFCVGK